MVRIVRTAQERKNELLDCAQTLFLEKGYEATTIADILDRIGLSKGAFYHHFASKEELLDAFTRRIAQSQVECAQEVLEDRAISELERLNRFLAKKPHESQPALFAVYLAALKPQNIQLHQRMVSVAAASTMPIISKILSRGVERGEFDVPDVQIVVEIIFQLENARWTVVSEAIQTAARGRIDAAVRMIENRLSAEQKLLERVLNLPQDSVCLCQPGFVRSMVTKLASMRHSRAAPRSFSATFSPRAGARARKRRGNL